MKKIIILACVLLLAGAGCTKAPKSKNNTPNNQAAQNSQNTPPVGEKKEKLTRPVETTLSNEENSELEKTFKEKSDEVGFKVYYPAFIPPGLILNKDNIQIMGNEQNGKLAAYSLNDANATTSPMVFIQEQILGMELDQKVTVDQESDYLKGYVKTIQNDAGQFYVLVFKKDEKTTIRINVRADIMDPDTLSKIAESMK